MTCSSVTASVTSSLRQLPFRLRRFVLCRDSRELESSSPTRTACCQCTENPVRSRMRKRIHHQPGLIHISIDRARCTRLVSAATVNQRLSLARLVRPAAITAGTRAERRTTHAASRTATNLQTRVILTTRETMEWSAKLKDSLKQTCAAAGQHPKGSRLLQTRQRGKGNGRAGSCGCLVLQSFVVA